eukprot:scaffold1772_cov80-Cylindrotheca_fusiformis.AAC.15
MAVPYLRNPNRSRRGLNNLELSKSTYHQEPEYYHVGRRTKGGGGGGYLYGGSSDSVPDDRTFAIVFGILGGIVAACCLFWCCLCCWFYVKEEILKKRETRTIGGHDNNTATSTATSVGVPPSCSITHMSSRMEMIRQYFKFQIVLPDRSNIDPRVLRQEENDDSTTNQRVLPDKSSMDPQVIRKPKSDDCTTDAVANKASIVAAGEKSAKVSSKSKKTKLDRLEKNKTVLTQSNTPAESCSSRSTKKQDCDTIEHYPNGSAHDVCTMENWKKWEVETNEDDKEGHDIESCIRSSQSQLSTWIRPTECSICLQAYETGQTICISTASQCDHVFHQECMEEWLKDHDNCPMCRVNFMYSSSE